MTSPGRILQVAGIATTGAGIVIGFSSSATAERDMLLFGVIGFLVFMVGTRLLGSGEP